MPDSPCAEHSATLTQVPPTGSAPALAEKQPPQPNSQESREGMVRPETGGPAALDSVTAETLVPPLHAAPCPLEGTITHLGVCNRQRVGLCYFGRFLLEGQ